jgi:release factor glutamine methyltransferase
MKIRELIRSSSEFLRSCGVESHRLDSEVLLSYLLGIGRERLYVELERDVEDEVVNAFKYLLRRRSKGEPVAYITGKKEFMGFEFEVDPSVMIPRPETEALVEEAVLVAERAEARVAVDMCTGSGNVAVSLALLCRFLFIVATDISPEAAAVAKRNARKHGVEDRVAVIVGDMWAPFGGKPVDIMTCNPPYIPSPVLEGLTGKESLSYEPRLALDGGEDGLDFYRAVIPETAEHLRDGGVAMFEVGYGQAERVISMLQGEGCWDRIWIRKDLNGIDRVVCGRKRG